MDGFFCFDAIASSLPLQSRRPALSKLIQQIFSRFLYAPYFVVVAYQTNLTQLMIAILSILSNEKSNH
jgi:hypothetical protein